MSLLVAGSVAYDRLMTPEDREAGRKPYLDEVEKTIDESAFHVMPGGSGLYASYAASFFTTPKLIATVGTDWNSEYSDLLRARGIDLEGLTSSGIANTTFWYAEYYDAMNSDLRHDIDFGGAMGGGYVPVIPDSYKSERYVLLANSSPTAGATILDSFVARPELTIADTIRFYIDNCRGDLDALIKRVDAFVLNVEEAKLLTGEDSAERAARKMLEWDLEFVIVKLGKNGAFWLGREGDYYFAPAYPLDQRKVKDATGAGDVFAGALMGVIAEAGDRSPETIERAMRFATAAASVNVEGFFLDRFKDVQFKEIEERAAAIEITRERR